MNHSALPEITVLMPAYNAELYIKEAVESILNQTFRNFEFLIINDGSTDKTLAILQSFNDSRIRIINQENKGLIDTLNLGIGEAKADIVARMDADDVSYPQRLERQLAFFKKHPDYVLQGSEADIIDKDGEFVYKLTPAGFDDDNVRAEVDKECPFIHPSVMFRKEAVLRAGGYPKNALTFEDHLLWKKMLSFGKVQNLKEVLVAYRFNPGSVTIDEKWRGKEFSALRRKALEQGYVSDEDADRLKGIIASQNFGSFKQAAYHTTIAKKFLWTNPDGAKARYNLLQAIKHYPQSREPYILYLFALLPAGIRTAVYKKMKNR
jgi:glycosyltransferase involved in cell wall biosynthesis